MIDNVGAIEVDILDKRTAIVAIKDYMFVLARRTAAFNHNADCVRRPDGRMRHIRWNEERFAFADQMIDDLVAFTNSHLNIALELIKILLRIHLVKVVPRIRSLDYHHEKVTAVVEIAIADRRFK